MKWSPPPPPTHHMRDKQAGIHGSLSSLLTCGRLILRPCLPVLQDILLHSVQPGISTVWPCVLPAYVPPPPCANTGLSKHGDPVFPHFWSFF